MSSIGGQPILRQACSIGGRPILARKTRFFSAAPKASVDNARAALASRSAVEAAAAAAGRAQVHAALRNTPISDISYGQWVATNAGSPTGPKQRREAVQKFLDSTAAPSRRQSVDRRSNTMYDLAAVPNLLQEQMGRETGLLQEQGTASQPAPLGKQSAYRASRGAAGSREHRMEAIQDLLDSTRNEHPSYLFWQAVKGRGASTAEPQSSLQRQPSFGLYPSGSTVEQLSSSLPGWAISTAGTRPVFSAGRWLEASKKESRSKQDRVAAVQQFYRTHG